MKDLLGRKVEVGNYIAYALICGRSANLAIYLVKEVFDYKIKAVKVNESYGYGKNVILLDSGIEIGSRYVTWDTESKKWREMTPEEKFKVDNKTTTLSKPERIFILDGFTRSLLEQAN